MAPRSRGKVRRGSPRPQGRPAAGSSGWRRGSPSGCPLPGPRGRRRYLILDVLLPPLGSDVRGEVLGELHPAAALSLPLGSSSSRRRRRRQQRLRLLPTWAPARHGAALLSSSAAAEVSSEPPSRHLPPPLHRPAPSRPPDVIAMVTAYATPTAGQRKRRGWSVLLGPAPFRLEKLQAAPLTSSGSQGLPNCFDCLLRKQQCCYCN